MKRKLILILNCCLFLCGFHVLSSCGASSGNYSVRDEDETLKSAMEWDENCEWHSPLGYSLLNNGTYEVSSVYSTRNHYNDVVFKIVIPSVHDGKPVTKIGSLAFGGVEDFISITIPDSVNDISESAFLGCCAKYITIGNGVENIGANAFSYCQNLEEITVPDSVKSIDKYAFRGCSSLTRVALPLDVTEISERSFNDCLKLSIVVVPDKVEKIGASAFAGCQSLTTVNLPLSLKEVNEDAFKFCNKLKRINYGGTIEEFYTLVDIYFKSSALSANVYCVDGRLQLDNGTVV